MKFTRFPSRTSVALASGLASGSKDCDGTNSSADRASAKLMERGACLAAKIERT